MKPSLPLSEILDALEQIAPLSLAESWDNVGLLVGDRCRKVQGIMTCLTITGTTLAEAIERRADLIVVHHPIPFKPVTRITADTSTGKHILAAIEAGIAIYSMHTAWDNAPEGINRQWAGALGLNHPTPLALSPLPAWKEANLGSGICGTWSPPRSVGDIRAAIAAFLPRATFRSTHPLEHPISKLGIVCGSGGSMVGSAAACGCDGFLTGEATYHQCLESEALGVAMILVGHHASEFFAMQSLAGILARRLPLVESFASGLEESLF